MEAPITDKMANLFGDDFFRPIVVIKLSVSEELIKIWVAIVLHV